MDICIVQNDSLFDVQIGGHIIEGVANYRILHSPDGGTEIDLKIKCPGSIMIFELSTN